MIEDLDERAVYLTDDRDLPDEDLRTLVIFPGGNGDWYVQVANKNGRTSDGVRLCTSGGASTQCPGLTVAIAEAYRAIIGSKSKVKRQAQPTYADLLSEVTAWRAKAAKYEYDSRFDEVVLKEKSSS